MKIFLFLLLLFLFGFLQAQSLQSSEDITLVRLNQASSQDSVEVEITFQVKDLSADQIQVLLGPSDGSGQYGVIQIEVKSKNGKKVLEEEGSEKELVNGKLVIRKSIPKDSEGKDVHIQVKGKKSNQDKYKVSKKVKM